MPGFIERTFGSFAEFQSEFDKFKQDNFVVFKRKSSETAEKANKKNKNPSPPQFGYNRIEYTCTHYGQPRVRGSGLKSKTKHSATGCEAFLVLKYCYYEKYLHISKSNLTHNHPTTPETFAQEYQVKGLAQHEREAVQELVELNPQNENLRRMVNSKFNKSYTLAEIRRLKHQLQSGCARDGVRDLLDNLEELQDHGQVKVVVSDNGNDSLVDIIAFSTSSMKSLFTRFPEVIYMDGTYKSNKSGFPLYQMMIEDGCGKGRTVFYAFVRLENADMLAKMMGVFVDFMGESVSQTKFAMTDKDHNEINAIKTHIPHISTMLCAFHVHKAMKAKMNKLQCSKEVKDRLQQLAYVLVTTNDVATFNRNILQIASLNNVFYDYICSHWLNCIDAWAYHARLHSRLFLNDTNNKCEGENMRLKEILNANTTMAVAVRKLFNYSLAQDLEVSAASAVQTLTSMHFRHADPRWHSFYALFTTHAVELMIQDHVSYPVPVVAVDDMYDCVDLTGVHYWVSGHPLSCSCPFFLSDFTTLLSSNVCFFRELSGHSG